MQHAPSGFQFNVELKQSPGKGLGVFTNEFIPKGSLVWTTIEGNHKVFNEQELRNFVDQNPSFAEFVLNHVYGWRDQVIFAIDDAAYVNHSAHPNLGVGHVYAYDDDDKGCFAARDIEAGEELLDDYKTYSNPEWYLELCKKYNVESALDVVNKYS